MLPYVMYSVEELSVVKDLGNWGNCNVQFIGKLLDSDGAKYICTGIEKIPPAEIELDFSLAAQIPPRNTMIRIWGELELMDNLPLVKAKVSSFPLCYQYNASIFFFGFQIVRVIESVDIPLYKKSLDSRRMFTPHFAPLESTEPT